jgi:hypothetical protein
MGTPPPPEAEAMMSIQPLHLTAAALPVILNNRSQFVDGVQTA